MTDDRFVRPGYTHAVGMLVEELGELVEQLAVLQIRFSKLHKALGKMIRHGPESINPLLPVEEQETNGDWIEREMSDVEGAIARYRLEYVKRIERANAIAVEQFSVE